MTNIKMYKQKDLPLEMHKVKIVQKLHLLPVQERLEKMQEAGSNAYLLHNKDIFMDMLTDSGVNAMSDLQQSAMLRADDAYAGSESFYRLEAKVQEIFNKEFFLPVHQGRAAENIISQTLVNEGDIVPMNYHFTTTKAHINRNGGEVVELLYPHALEPAGDHLFKGNMDLEALTTLLEEDGDKVPFVRMEAGTNLIGGQPFSLENLAEVSRISHEANKPLVLDASLLTDNLYFNKEREEQCKDMSIREITKAISDLCDIVYFSARKISFSRGGGIVLNDRSLFLEMGELVTLYEGFLTYGGMSVKEIEAMTVGFDESMDMDYINQGPKFIQYMVDELTKAGVPVVTPAGGLGCHLDASAFLPHIPQEEYPAGALAAAMYIAGGIRGMERGTLSEDRLEDGSENLADMELLRLAVPRRVFTLSQINYVIDRIIWLHDHKDLVGGLTFVEEPEILRFFIGRLEPTDNWQETLATAYQETFE